jgi:glycosyltransferase involved in cell wall biosynthesis
MTAQPQVTLVVIAYNEERRIGRCLAALAAQDHPGPYEILVVDDGSTDRTSQVAAAADARVRVLRLPTNQGRGAARRHGVAAATGTVIGFVDADIEVGTDWLRRCLEHLPGHAAVGGIAVPDGDVAPLVRITGVTPRPVDGSMPITGNNVVFDGEILKKTGFDENAKLGEDFRLAARLLAEGYRLKQIPGLAVKHNETKSYRKSFLWLYQSGKDATQLLVEHRRWRTPDSAWALGVLASILGLVLAAKRPWAVLLGPVAVAGVSVLHSLTRFEIRPLRRFLWASVLNLPLTGAYLTGRCVGVLRRRGGSR